MQGFWEDNRKSLLRFLGEAHRGVKGFVKDENFQPIEGASMKVRGRDVGFQTTKEGEFWRILLPGIYTMEVFAEGYAPREVQFAIVEQNPTMLNVTLYQVFGISFCLKIYLSYCYRILHDGMGMQTMKMQRMENHPVCFHLTL